MQIDWFFTLGILLTSVLTAVAGLLVTAILPGRNARQAEGLFTQVGQGTIFLFDGDALLDATPDARALLRRHPQNHGAAKASLLACLAPHFPDLDQQLQRLAQDGAVTLTSAPGIDRPLVLHAEQRGGLARLVLIDPEAKDQAPCPDPMLQRATNDELDLLRQTVAKAPILIWREREDREVVWANAAYMARAAQHLAPGKDLSWPLPRLFERTATLQGSTGQRQRLGLPDGGDAWFELVSFAEGSGHLMFALPIDAAVQAESALRDFLQTLTKTFAHLPIGLAIFDRARHLQLFNPALMDLTGLPVDFLSMRPSLLSVLDAMRDRAMIPEPKDYRTWRMQMIDMEKAAASALYDETWSLPGGQTYRVTGRPHPNGAIALMIEDISVQMRRTRRFRADLELGQSVIDEIDDAIAVFSEAGVLVMSNAAYSGIWGHDPVAGLGESTVRSLCDHWRKLSAPSAIWAEMEEYAANPKDRVAWSAEARLLDGRLLGCRFAPLAGGATLATFRAARSGDTVQTRIASSLKSA